MSNPFRPAKHAAWRSWGDRMNTQPTHYRLGEFQAAGARAAMAICGTACALLLATGCGPSEQEKAKWAEEKRIDCLDKICEGDKPPKLDRPQDDVVMKLNGEYFIAPRAYASSFSWLAFYWPSKTPLTGRADRQPWPEQRERFYDVAIEIFLGHYDGRNYGPERYEFLRQAEREGRLLSKDSPRPGLEVWRIEEANNSNGAVWYVATSYVDTDPNGAVLRCGNEPGQDTCGAGFIWRPGISAGMRLKRRHAPDWPEIYQETRRILNLLKKA